jgi:hypothetical protein
VLTGALHASQHCQRDEKGGGRKEGRKEERTEVKKEGRKEGGKGARN